MGSDRDGSPRNSLWILNLDMRRTAEEYYDAERQRSRATEPLDADGYKQIALAAIRAAVADELERCILVAKRHLGDILRHE